MGASTRKLGSLTLLTVGAFLLILNTLGFFLSPDKVVDRIPTDRERVAGYDFVEGDYLKLLDRLEGNSTSFDLEEVTKEIYLSIAHGDDRFIMPYENWVMWIGGKLYPPLRRTQDPVRLVRGGRALCGQVSRILITIAAQAGIPARFVGLEGHVVASVKTEDGWRVADPDYGLVFPYSIEELERKENREKIVLAIESRGWSGHYVDQYVEFFQTASDNKVFPVATALNPRLWIIERASETLKWLIPLMFLLVSFLGMRDPG